MSYENVLINFILKEVREGEPRGMPGYLFVIPDSFAERFFPGFCGYLAAQGMDLPTWLGWPSTPPGSRFRPG